MARQIPPEMTAYFQKLGKKGGRVGGKISAELLTDQERKERARAAGIASGKVRAAKAKKRKAAAKG